MTTFDTIQIGEFFRTEPDGDVYERSPEGTFPDWPLRNAINLTNESGASLGPLAHVISVPPDEMHTCRRCSDVLHVSQMRRVVTRDYPWDGSDLEGSILETTIEWECRDRRACHQNRREMWELSKQMAHFADQEAAEQGVFGIGGGCGNSY